MLRKILCTKNKIAAFTLVELLVSITIMVMVLGITVAGGPQAIMRLTLSDNAYNVEVLLREAQLQGSAVNSLNGLYGGRGIVFDITSFQASTKVLKFKDSVDTSITNVISVGNGLYDGNQNIEREGEYNLVNRNHVGALCVAQNDNPFSCTPFGSSSLQTLTISFTRPKENANIYVNGATTTKYSKACIQIDSIRSPEPGYVRSVIVYQSGMIVKKIGTCI